ncbi:AbrB family transcriptional regulator [Ureibacillus aquaedulcis]|uniref:AbrB family transcriptional regulator n=1 Tax=Ureibacillus aquaedulcis TaxID=3058421 RepID=A0ABT8GKN5_9BACL|nr:AbrB family transcriptional regulator [Ureibacillus sp. BA0131]MDN4491977.1 AbrB family transcriptional regulator [Ureibacillus sp. BA0131]
MKSITLISIISVIGAVLFDVLGLPVPWMLGPLFAVLISQFFIKIDLSWPVQFRNAGLIIIGISIGQTFQLNVFSGMGWLVLLMLLINIALVIISIAMAFGVHKIGNVPLKTALTCTVPGGLSQIVVFAEEEKDINLAVVTYFHVVRVVSIVMVIPFVLSGHVVQPGNAESILDIELLPLLLLLLVARASVWIGKKVKLPVPYFLSPVLLIMALTLFSIETPPIPGVLLHIAQLLMGAYIGLLLKPKMIKLGKKVILLGIGSALLLIALTFAQGFLLMHFLGYSISTSFLSTAAGGLDQMSLLATAIGADVSAVTVFQIFRLLFVFIVILPLLKMACSYLDKKQAKELHEK